MRILALYHTMDRPETALINGVAAAGVSVTVGYNPDGGFSHLLSDSIRERFILRCRSRLDWRAMAQLRRVVRAGQFDLIHAHTGRTLSAALGATTGLRHRPLILGYRGALGNVSAFDPSSWISFRHPRVAGIFCVSKAVAEDLLARGFAPEKLCQIYKGHEVSWYERAEMVGRESLHVPSAAFIVGCVANMRPNKGIDDLLAAAALLEQTQQIHLVLIGSMEGAQALPQFRVLSHPERIHFLGFQEDVAKFLPMMNCFVMPTKWVEGFPKAVIEAMCQQVPAVVTRVGGMKELVRNEVDGLVVDPCSPAQLAAAITRLVESPQLAASLGAQGRRRIAEDFPLSKSVAESLRWYQSFLVGQGGAA